MYTKTLLAASFALIAPLYAAPISQLVVFGDSLSDTGNAASSLPGGVIPGNYASPRLTDGTNTLPATTGPLGLWIDQFAADLGLADPAPGYAVPGGTNFAVATAQTGTNSQFFITDQVNLYLKEVAGTANPSALYAIWAGANDLPQGTNPVTAADNLYNNILTLSASGAKNFLWLNLPPLGESPDAVAAGATVPLNAASALFDAEWTADLAKLKAQNIQATGVDVNALFNDIVAHPGKYNLTNVTDPAWCGTLGLPTCASNNPNQFLFWDGEHPTTAADAFVAAAAVNALSPAGPAVPEPRSAGLVLIGLAAMLFAGRLARRRA